MFARMIQLTAMLGKERDLSKAVEERALPMLRSQPGFVDALGLSSDTAPNQFVGISLWKTKKDAEKYISSSQAQQILESIKPLLQETPSFRTFNVETLVTSNVGIGHGASST